MKVLSRLFLGLGLFLLVTAVPYGLHSREGVGGVLMLTAAGCAVFVGSFLVHGLRAGGTQSVESGALSADDGEPHVGPTIWPVFLAVAIAGLVVGAIASPWVLVLGGVLLFAAGVGWILDVSRQWEHHFRHPVGEPSQGGQHHPQQRAG